MIVRVLSQNSYQLTRSQGTRTPDASAEVVAMLALLPPYPLPSGRFFLGFGPYNKSRL